jgi:ABC-2 type transport system permease protein
MSIAAPIVIAAFFGAIFGSGGEKPTRVPIAVVDADASALTKAGRARCKGDTTFEVRELPEADAVALAQKGKVRAAIVLPAGFGAKTPGGAAWAAARRRRSPCTTTRRRRPRCRWCAACSRSTC